MHPDTYHFFANERIAGLRRDADRRRLARLAAGTSGRATVHHAEPVTPAGVPNAAASLASQRGG